MSELATKGDVEQSRQAARDLIDIMQGVLAEKIDKLGTSVDAKFQSLENTICAFQSKLDKLTFTFLEGQEERHKELTRICNTINNHERRLLKLESKNSGNGRLIT